LLAPGEGVKRAPQVADAGAIDAVMHTWYDEASMRTTITIDDRLLAQLKKRAAEAGTSVSGLIEQAVRLLFRTPPAPKGQGRFELVTFGSGGRFSRLNVDKTSALLEADDVDRFARHR
jgi:hypothetical protein